MKEIIKTLVSFLVALIVMKVSENYEGSTDATAFITGLVMLLYMKVSLKDK